MGQSSSFALIKLGPIARPKEEIKPYFKAQASCKVQEFNPKYDGFSYIEREDQRIKCFTFLMISMLIILCDLHAYYV